jgi:hypothetical protein
MPNFSPLRSLKFRKKATDNTSKQEARKSKPKVDLVTAFNATTAQLSTTSYVAGPSTERSYRDPSLFSPAITDLVDESIAVGDPPSTPELIDPAGETDEFGLPVGPAEGEGESGAQSHYQV